MNSIFFVKRIRIKLLFSEKFGILKITGGTPGLACAISAGKKMVLDQKPPLQREQVVGSSRILYIIYYIKQPENKIWLFLCSWNFFLQKYLKIPAKILLYVEIQAY